MKVVLLAGGAGTRIFERDILQKLAAEGELMSYPHKGFWQSMDNLREKQLLERLWKAGNAPWRNWK